MDRSVVTVVLGGAARALAATSSSGTPGSGDGSGELQEPQLGALEDECH